jgi:6-phosphogluconolactonase
MCTSAEQLAVALVQTVMQQIIAAINAQGVCHMVIPGGGTPQLFFEHLSRVDLPWNDVHLYPSDERCVPVGDKDRNDRMIEEELLSRVTMPSEQLHRIPAELGPDVGARIYGRLLQKIPAFDIAVLGVGADGHIASLFPGHAALYSNCAAVPVVMAPKPPYSRVSIGLRRLRAAGNRHVIALGAEKKAAICRVGQSDVLPVLQLGGDVWCA